MRTVSIIYLVVNINQCMTNYYCSYNKKKTKSPWDQSKWKEGKQEFRKDGFRLNWETIGLKKEHSP